MTQQSLTYACWELWHRHVKVHQARRALDPRDYVVVMHGVADLENRDAVFYRCQFWAALSQCSGQIGDEWTWALVENGHVGQVGA